MKKTILLLLLLFSAAIVSAQKTERYVVMISLDGFRWDYTQWYDTPFLDRMAAEGTESGLIPCFPSKTFPNHYSIATGLIPDHHGIIANSFMDKASGERFSLSNAAAKNNPEYWGGEPLWLTAKHQGVRTAVFYWPGSDVAINDEYPDKYFVYDDPNRLTMQQRTDSIVAVMQLPENERPHLVMSYMEEPDYSGHHFGPQDKRTRQAVNNIDTLIESLYNRLMTLPYADKIDFIVLSDHGMALVTPERRIPLMDKLQPEWVEAIEGDMPANIYVKPGHIDDVYNALKATAHLSVWKKGEVPAELAYGTNRNCGDVIASPDLGYVASDKETDKQGGMHGFDPNYNDMHALFRAVGPDFRHTKAAHFSNTNVYPMVCHLLGIQPASCDGSLNDVRGLINDFTPLVAAHRGWWTPDGSAQNSIASLRMAAEAGFWGSEFDVHMTLDGGLVVNHDNDIDGMVIEDTNYKDLKNCRLKNGERLPTLEQYLKEGKKHKNIRLVLEIKSHKTADRENTCTDKVLAMVKKFGLESRTDYIAFSLNVCKRLAQQKPDANIAYLEGDIAPAELRKMGINGIDYEQTVLRNHPEWIRQAHALGMTVNVWTVNADDAILHFITEGVDVITTNRPEAVKGLGNRE